MMTYSLGLMMVARRGWGSSPSILLLLFSILPSISLTVPLEAAFQGQCEAGNPCEQTCFNLHDKMYECDCREGFYLHTNGYNCIPFNKSEPAATSKPIAIQIEVDIEPPEDTDGLDGEQLARLGLPSHHVHYRAGQPAGSELLAPEDIQVSYTEEEEAKKNSAPSLNHRRQRPKTEAASAAATIFVDGEEMVVDPPRALPARQEVISSGGSVVVADVEPAATDQPELSLDVEDLEAIMTTTPTMRPILPFAETAPEEGQLTDTIYGVPAFCGLDCGPAGRCHNDEVVVGGWTSRCLCPIGWRGKACAQPVHGLEAAQLTGLSYLALPTLQNAYSDLHLSIDFRPTSGTGLILITGETEDMTGDYLALLLNDGFIELRLDCGTGPGVVRTSQRVEMEAWNHLSVYRHDWGVWIQLNGGKQEEGRSQGLFSRITFNQPVYVGGVGEMRNVGNFLGLDSGFQGCVRSLHINQRLYDLRPVAQGGDVIGGRDIDDCSAPGCTDSMCGSGTCRRSNHSFSGCNCPLGYTGTQCQTREDIQVPSFDGSSYLRHPGLGEAGLIWLELEVVFKSVSENAEGLILYNGDKNDGQGDFMAVFMNQGYLEFAFDVGNGIAIARCERPVIPHTWHQLTVSRTGREAYITLDGEEVASGLATAPGAFTQLSLSQNLWVGGVADPAILSAYLPITKGLKGCIQKVVVNGLALELTGDAVSGLNVGRCEHGCSAEKPCGPGKCVPLLAAFACQCPAGRHGTTCERSESVPSALPEEEEEAVTLTPTSPAFTGDSFLYFSNQEIYQNLVGGANSINIRLRLSSSHGLLLWTGGTGQDQLLLGIHNGYVQFSVNLGSGELMLEYNATKVDDGVWHRIRVTRQEQTVSLMVDNGDVITGTVPGKLRQLNTQPELYLGGSEDTVYLAADSRYRTGVTGCIAELSIGNMVNINLLHVAERGRNIESCEAP